MEWVISIIIIFILIDIEEKLKRIMDNNDKIDSKKITLEQYLNKEVYIILNDDCEISDQYLFTVGQKNVGKIIDFDNHWVVFQYHNKTKKETISQYLKIKDIESIDEINNHQ